MIGNKTELNPMKLQRKWRIMDAIKPWKTANAVALAGTWSNRFRNNDGRALTDPCPCVLIQERGSVTRAVFGTYLNGEIMPACEMEGYEDSSTSPRTSPHRSDKPPWLRLDEIDPVRKPPKKQPTERQ